MTLHYDQNNTELLSLLWNNVHLVFLQAYYRYFMNVLITFQMFPISPEGILLFPCVLGLLQTAIKKKELQNLKI